MDKVTFVNGSKLDGKVVDHNTEKRLTSYVGDPRWRIVDTGIKINLDQVSLDILDALLEPPSAPLSPLRLHALEAFEIRCKAFDLHSWFNSTLSDLAGLKYPIRISVDECEIIITEAKWGSEAFEIGKVEESEGDGWWDRVRHYATITSDLNDASEGREVTAWSYETRVRGLVDTIEFVKVCIK